MPLPFPTAGSYPDVQYCARLGGPGESCWLHQGTGWRCHWTVLSAHTGEGSNIRWCYLLRKWYQESVAGACTVIPRPSLLLQYREQFLVQGSSLRACLWEVASFWEEPWVSTFVWKQTDIEHHFHLLSPYYFHLVSFLGHSQILLSLLSSLPSLLLLLSSFFHSVLFLSLPPPVTVLLSLLSFPPGIIRWCQWCGWQDHWCPGRCCSQTDLWWWVSG